MNNLINKEIDKIYNLVHQKQFNFAKKTAHLILKRDPNNPKIFDLIGDIYNAQNKQMQSIWYYYSALDRQFNNKTLYKLGTNIYYLGKYDEAEKILNSVIEQDPVFISAYLTLAQNHEENDKIEDAIMCYEAVIELEPKDCIFRINRDIRFSKDKTPYKLHASAAISKNGRKDMDNAGIYIQLDPEYTHLYSGFYYPSKEKLYQIRTNIASKPKQFEALKNDSTFKAVYGEILGDKNKVLPKEFKEAAQQEPLIYNKAFYYVNRLEPETALKTNLLQTVMDHYKAAHSLNKFLSE